MLLGSSATSGIAELSSIHRSISTRGTSSRLPTRRRRTAGITWRSKLSREIERAAAASSIERARGSAEGRGPPRGFDGNIGTAAARGWDADRSLACVMTM